MLNEIIKSATVPDVAACPPVRWGILAPGGIARKFASDVQVTGATVTAVGSRSLERAETFADEFGIPAAAGSYEELVARDDVDAIYVASPHSHHREHALLAIDAGKAVLVEKAFTRNAAEAREVIDAAREANVFVMEAMWSRFLPHMVAARALVAHGAIGEVTQIVADHCQAISHVQRLVDPELAGGALLDLGVYPLSFIHSVLGVPDSIVTRGSLLETGVDATSTTALNYGDVSAVATTSLRTKSPVRAWIGGTEGYIDFDRGFYQTTGFEVVRHDGEKVRFQPSFKGRGHDYPIAEASRCIAEGALESEIFPLQGTIEVMEIMDEVRRQLGVRYPNEPSLRPPHPATDAR